MDSTINSPIQDLNVQQKKPEQPGLAKRGDKTGKPQRDDADISIDTIDTVEIQSSSRQSIEFKDDSNEIRDVEEAQNTKDEVIGLINNTEGEKSPDEQVHSLNTGRLIDLLA